LDSLLSYTAPPHPQLLAHLKLKQQQKLKGHVVDIKNRYNEIVLSFDPFNKEFSPGQRIIDFFENFFSFHIVKNNNNNNFKAHCLSLDNITLTSLLNSLIALVVIDTSIKNRVVISIAHIHCWDCSIMKTIHYAINVMFTKAELFTIIYSINQAT